MLLPTELAGTTYVRHTPGGPIEERFPERISPRRDISDIQSLHYAAGPVDVELRFEGDLFDMEDQRNWTDASYKTFCTPLARPFPVQVVAGERIRQTVTFEPRVPPEVGGSVDVDGAPKVEVVERVVGSLPPIGLGAAFDATPLSQPAIERLQALRPSHLRVELDLRSPAWPDVLHVATADAAALGSALDIAVVTDADGSGINEVWAALRSSAARVVRFAPFAEALWVTTPPLVAAARVAGVTAAVGGGSRTDFAQLNMRQALIPFGELDFVTYAITPQVHTFDDMSIVETLAVQAATVESARALAGERPILVAPITLRPRFNPNATAPEPPPLPGAPPAQADPRQTTAFCAAWTVGSLRRLASAGASALTYFETAGACGVMDAAGAPYPVYDVLAAVVPLVGAEILEVRLSDPLALEALALRKATACWWWWRTSLQNNARSTWRCPPARPTRSISGHTQRRTSMARDATLARVVSSMVVPRRTFLRLAGGGVVFGSALLAACTPAPPAAPTVAAPVATMPPAAATSAPHPDRGRRAAHRGPKPTAAAGAAVTRVGAVVLPTRVPITVGPQPDLPGNDEGVDPGYFGFPADLFKSVPEMPAQGGEFTTITVITGVANRPLEQNPAWQERQPPGRSHAHAQGARGSLDDRHDPGLRQGRRASAVGDLQRDEERGALGRVAAGAPHESGSRRKARQSRRAAR